MQVTPAAPQGAGGTTWRIALPTPPPPQPRVASVHRPPLAPPAEGRTGASRADSGLGRLWGREAATALPRPQLAGCTALLPALRVTQRLLCAPSTHSQAPTHSAHSWHSRLCRAGTAPSPTPAAAVRWGGGWQRARVSANRPACPWASPRSARRETAAWPRGDLPRAGAGQSLAASCAVGVPSRATQQHDCCPGCLPRAKPRSPYLLAGAMAEYGETQCF